MFHHCSPMTTSYNDSMYSTSSLVSIPFYAIPIFPSKFQFFNLVVFSPFFLAAFSKSVENNTMKATLAHSYMYQ